jgi:hypothetical protein
MELQSANLSLQSNSPSPALLESSQSLSSSSVSSTQALISEQQRSSSSPSVESSAVVNQLVVGSKAAVAVYGQLVSSGVSQERQSQMTGSSAAVLAQPATVQPSNKIANHRNIELAELKVVQQLASRDREVRAHEQTHAAIGGNFAGAPTYDFTSGPDGQMYATSGKVSIDTSAVENDPRATLEKAQVIIRAALSVSDPSTADRQIAAEAKSLALKALSELREGDSSIAKDDSAAIRDSQLQLEQQRLEREEFLAEEQLKQARQDRNEALSDSRKQSNDNSLEVLKEYNTQISEIQETLRRLNTQLVDSGAFGKAFPEGFLIDQNV